jgi:hypothetical protein
MIACVAESSRDAGTKLNRFRINALLIAAAMILAATSPLRAEIVVDHQPHNTGGLASDTSFQFPGFPNELWQRVADDFTLSETTILRRVHWWAFYDSDSPPLSETIRLRFYESRPSDGLPDESRIVREETVVDPLREWTGRLVGVGILPREYFFTMDLSSELQLESETQYWLEIVQLGDIGNHYRWEFALADLNGQAFINNGGAVDWVSSLPGIFGDTAFQLSMVPEPNSMILYCTVLACCILRRRSLKRGLSSPATHR